MANQSSVTYRKLKLVVKGVIGVEFNSAKKFDKGIFPLKRSFAIKRDVSNGSEALNISNSTLLKPNVTGT